MTRTRKPGSGSGRGTFGGSRGTPLPGQMGLSFDPDNPKPYIVPAPAPKRELMQGTMVHAYLWSRTVLCPNCTGLIPLAPNWRLSPQKGLRLFSHPDYLVCDFAVVPRAEMSPGTIRKGITTCPHCGTTTPKGYIRDECAATPHEGGDKPWFVGETGRFGSVEYCKVCNYYYPIYRAGKPPKQGKIGPFYVVSYGALRDGWLVRKWCLVNKGLYRAEDDPDLWAIGAVDGKDPPLMPGLQRLACEMGYASVDEMWQHEDVESVFGQPVAAEAE